MKSSKVVWHDAREQLPPPEMPVFVYDEDNDGVYIAEVEDWGEFPIWERWNNAVEDQGTGRIACWAFFPPVHLPCWIPNSRRKPEGLEIAEALVQLSDQAFEVLAFHNGHWRREYIGSGCAEEVPDADVDCWMPFPAKPEGWR